MKSFFRRINNVFVNGKMFLKTSFDTFFFHCSDVFALKIYYTLFETFYLNFLKIALYCKKSVCFTCFYTFHFFSMRLDTTNNRNR